MIAIRKLPDSVYFVAINIIVSGVGFIRSFIYMKGLDMFELGILTIIQTVILFISLLQFGLINGGYRLFAIGKSEDNAKVNDLLFTYFGTLACVLFISWSFSLFFEFELNSIYIFLSFLLGIVALVYNWVNNVLIGTQKIAEINIINLWNIVIGIISLPLPFYYGLQGAVITLVLQYSVFITLALIRNSELRPTQLYFDLKQVRYILNFGFIPFLAGIFGIVNTQIERWGVVKFLGISELGVFYLVFLYTTLFVLIPASLNSLFFPKTVKCIETGNKAGALSLIYKYYLLLVAYITVAVALTYFFLEIIILNLVPSHVVGVKYVFLVLPGLAFIALSDPLALLFNSSVRLRPISISHGISIVVNLVGVFFLLHYNIFNLENLGWLRSLLGVVVFFGHVIGLLILWRKVLLKNPNICI